MTNKLEKGKLPFLDREPEQRRLAAVLGSPGGALAVVYGRRRCGKSTLLQRVARDRRCVYYLADEREARPQLASVAAQVAPAIPGFALPTYESWHALLSALALQAKTPLNLILDEFPCLVQGAPELPSLLQNLLDQPGDRRLNLVLCGSSQRMMHGLVLDAHAPLYGRASAVLKIEPLLPGWLPPAFPRLTAAEAIEAYAVWGGVPRYWELAAGFPTTLDAVADLVLDRNGVLHEEPLRLLLDDLRSAAQPFSVLSLVGAGCHRLSEIAGRLGKPAVGLSRPLNLLGDLGYLRRDLPFGETTKSTKRTLYRLSDPFFQFYFRFVQPRLSELALGLVAPVRRTVQTQLAAHVGGTWEDLARWSVPFLDLGARRWGPAARWWSTHDAGRAPELDLVARTEDGKALLVGEAKWSDLTKTDVARAAARLRQCAAALPLARGRELVVALWAKSAPPTPGCQVVTPDQVLAVLR